MIVPLNEYDFLKRALAVYGDCEAIVSGDLRLTYQQFGDRVNRWANAMRSLGVQQRRPRRRSFRKTAIGCSTAFSARR